MKRFCITTLVLLLAFAMYAKDIKRPDSYNYMRAEEAVNNGNLDEALDYLQKELADNPKNGYAYFRTAWIYLQKGENGNALSFVDKALKFLPKKDGEYIGYSHNVKANVFSNLGQDDKAIEELGLSIKAQPEDIDYLNFRGQKYYDMEKYDLSDADYRQITKIEPGSMVGFLGLGRNAEMQEKYAEAEKNYDYAVKLSPEEPQCYLFRADCYVKQKKWDKAIEDAVKAASINASSDVFDIMAKISDEPQFSQLIARLEIEAKKRPEEVTFPVIAAALYNTFGKPQNAIPYLKKNMGKGNDESLHYMLADIYAKLGMYDEAAESNKIALESDSTSTDYLQQKVRIARNSGNVKEAIAAATNMIDNDRTSFEPYMTRGIEMLHAGLYDGATDDFSTAISIEPGNTHALLYRGYCHTKLGNTEMARADYEKVTEIDSVPKTATEAMFAYAMLGNRAKAVEMCDSVLANDSTQGSLYNAACLYSRLNEPEKACGYLRRVFDKGVFELAHIDGDFDMENMRGNEEYKKIMEEQRKVQAEIVEKTKGEPDDAEYEDEEVEMPFTKEGTLYKVKCSVNELPLSFIFDTGASDVSMSMVEATFMMKNGYLSKKDVIGSANFLDANGNINAGTVINLRKVDLGGVTIGNVRASVVQNQKAPLLLGQTVLNRAGKIEIDNDKRVMRITHKVRK